MNCILYFANSRSHAIEFTNWPFFLFSLEKLQAEIIFAETKAKQHLDMLKEAAMLLEEKKSELERLNSEVLTESVTKPN